MISDRPYMQSDYRPRQQSILKWIVLVTIGVFILQNIEWATAPGRLFQDTYIGRLFALSPLHLQAGFLWTIVTYAFLHGGVLHILFNMLIVFLFGRELLPLLGNRRFGQLYFGAAIMGGLFWLLFNFQGQGLVVGASASAIAMLIFFACLYPNREITFLLFLIIPVRLKPKYMAYFVVGMDLFGFLFAELGQGRGLMGDNVAHSAHLGGALAAWLFFKYVFSRQTYYHDDKPLIETPAWFKRKSKVRKAAGNYSVNLFNRRYLQTEVDRILDKINAEGFHSLTEEEKKVLERAKDLLSK